MLGAHVRYLDGHTQVRVDVGAERLERLQDVAQDIGQASLGDGRRPVPGEPALALSASAAGRWLRPSGSEG